MAGGLKVGDLYIAVTASIGEAMKKLGDLSKATKDMAEQVKKAAEPVGAIGAMVAAGIAGAVAAAVQSNAKLKAETERLTKLLYTLAADIGDLFAPAVKRIADVVERLVASFQRLSPETRQAAADLAVWVAQAGLAVGAAGKMAGAVEGLAGGVGAFVKVMGALNSSTGLASVAAGISKLAQAMKGSSAAAAAGAAAAAAAGKEAAAAGATTAAAATRSGGAIAALGRSLLALAVPVAAVAAALAAVVLLAGAVYGAWTDSSTGLRDSVMRLLAAIAQFAQKIWDIITSIFSTIGKAIRFVVTESLNVMAWLVRKMAGVLLGLTSKLPKSIQMGNLNKALEAASGLTGDDLVEGGVKAGAAIADALKAGAIGAYDHYAERAKAIKDFGSDVVSTGASGAIAGTKKLLTDTGIWPMLERLFSSADDEQAKAAIRQKDSDKEIEVSAPASRELEFEMVKRLRDLAAKGSEGVQAMNKAMTEKSKALAEAMKRAAEEARRAVEEARASIRQKFASALGGIGELVDTFMQALTASGGNPLAAVGAVIADLMMQSEGFGELMQMVAAALAMVADTLGAVLAPLQPLVASVFMVVQAVVSALVPVFQFVADALKPLVPPLVIVAQLLQGLAPLLDTLGKLFMAIMNPLMLIAGPVLKALFEVLKFVGTVILTVARAIGTVWNSIVSAVQWVIRGISKAVEWLGIDALKDFAKSLDKMKVDTDSMGESLRTLRDTTWDSANATAQNTAETLRNYEAQRRANEALSNVPQAWKIALRRFQVQDAQRGPTSEPARPAPAPSPAPSPGAPAPRPPPTSGPLTAPDDDSVELPDYKDPRDRELRGATKGDTYNIHITGYDIDEAVQEGASFVERQQARGRYRGAGRLLAKTVRYA